MNDLPRLLRALFSPLVIEPRTGAALINLFGRKFVLGESFTVEEIHAEAGVAARSRSRSSREPTIAVIPIHGIINRRAFSMGTGVDQIDADFDAAIADERVDAILFDVDSPGGHVDGVPELAEKIRSARGQKPMIALADTMMASGAYWIGSAADQILSTPSGQLGSVGVWTAHEDWSRWLGNEGVDITTFSAGKYKIEGNPWSPLTEETKEFFQAQIDEVYGWFVQAVAKNRRDSQANVLAGYGEGRLLNAEASVKANLADAVATFDQAFEQLAGRIRRRGKNASSLRRRLELDTADASP